MSRPGIGATEAAASPRPEPTEAILAAGDSFSARLGLCLGLWLALRSGAMAQTPESFALRLPAAVAVASGGEALLAVSIQRDGYQGTVTVAFMDLPAGIQIEPATPSPAGQSSWRGTVKAAPETVPGVRTIRVRARGGRFSQESTFELMVAQVAPDEPSKPDALVLTAPFATPPPQEPTTALPPSAPGDRWLLMKLLQGTALGMSMDSERIRLYGWTDMSYTASTDRKTNLPLAFDYVANDFLLQQNWVRFERSVITSGTSSPSFGWRIDSILPGSDYRFTLPRGLWNSQLTASDGRPNRYGVDIIQFYAESYFPTIGAGMDVKVGRFFAQYGVESNAAADNFFESHVYSYVYNPFTQMGIVATTKANDTWSFQAGLVNGNDVFIDPADSPYGIGSVKWAAPTRPDTLLFSFILGSGRFNTARQFHNPEVLDLIYTRKLNTRTNYIFEAIYGLTYNVPEIGFANWNGVVNYLLYDFTPRLTGGTRLEFFNDAQGFRTGFKGLYSDLTTGVNFKPCKSIIFRPELRYDYNLDSKPFEGKHGLFTACADVIFRW